MSVMVLDSGNSIIKAKIARRLNGEIVFPHVMKQLTESEYEKVTNRIGIRNQSAGYLRINGTPYVVGESAERHGFITQRTGTARYTLDYYGILAAAALGRYTLIEKESLTLPVEISHQQLRQSHVATDF